MMKPEPRLSFLRDAATVTRLIWLSDWGTIFHRVDIHHSGQQPRHKIAKSRRRLSGLGGSARKCRNGRQEQRAEASKTHRQITGQTIEVLSLQHKVRVGIDGDHAPEATNA